MEFKGLKIDFVGLSQALLAIAALFAAFRGARKSKITQDKKKSLDKTP